MEGQAGEGPAPRGQPHCARRELNPPQPSGATGIVQCLLELFLEVLGPGHDQLAQLVALPRLDADVQLLGVVAQHFTGEPSNLLDPLSG